MLPLTTDILSSNNHNGEAARYSHIPRFAGC